MSLVLDAVHASYGSSEVLRGIELTVPAGRVVALLGANGAGKTTALRVASGLLAASRGRVVVDGLDVTVSRPSSRAARGVCHVPEGRAVFPSLTVAENVRLMSDGTVDAPIDRAVDAFPALGGKLTQQAGTMSGGEQQMLALARAYVTSPCYVLLDEVSMGLAPIVIDQIFEFLKLLARTGVALLIVEQYVAMALELADLAYVLQKGRVAFCGEPDELDADALAASYLGAPV